MKIACIVGQFPNISETFVLNQMTGLLDRGHELTIFSSHPGSLDQEHACYRDYQLADRTIYFAPERNKLRRIFSLAAKVIKYLPRYPGQLIGALNVVRFGWKAITLQELHERIFWLEFKNRTFDIIYCHFGHRAHTVAQWVESGYLSGKLAVVFHAYDLAQYVIENGIHVYKQLFTTGDLFLAITEYAHHKLLALGCPEEKMVIHHMGIDCRQFSYSPRERTIGETFQLIIAGRMVEKKGFKYAIEAINHVISKGFKVHATLVGDGVLRAQLEAQVASLGIQDCCTFTGWQTQEQLQQLYMRSHAMLAPSVTTAAGDQEGLPVVLMEALAVGLPVIASRHAGIPELIEDAITGLLVAERDVNALAQKIMDLYNNRDLCRILAYQGRKRVEQSFNIDRLNDQLDNLFHDLVSGTRVGSNTNI